MRKTIAKVLILTIVCVLFLTGCENKKDVTESTASTEPTSSSASVTENASTAKPTETKKEPSKAPSTITGEPTEPTKTPTKEPTKVPTKEPTQVPTKEPTTAPTQAPTATPTAVAKPTADPAIYPDDWGMDVSQLPIKTDGTKFFWKNSRVIYDIPKNAPSVEEWYAVFSDEKNDQLVFYTGDMSEGTYTYYAIVEGEFYKLSEGKIVKRSMHSGKNQLWWIEDNGIAKSVNVRSNKYNDVYLDAENVKGFVDVDPPRYLTFNGEIISPITENILLQVKKIN